MNATVSKKLRRSTIGATAAAMALPALLLAGAGTANANAFPAWYSQRGITVNYQMAGPVLSVRISDYLNPDGVTEACTYRSTGIAPTPRIPFAVPILVTGKQESYPVILPALQLGGTWSVSVQCGDRFADGVERY